jgi:Cdc6-like AAA superfamily ATPase
MSIPVAKLRKLQQVGEVFTPGAPIDRWAIFAGRWDQVLEIVNATGNRGQHVVMYGERGVGKTSLANVLTEIFDELDNKFMQFARINCNSTDDFDSIWSNVFKALEIELPQEKLMSRLTPEDVRFLLEGNSRLLVVLDELDRVENKKALTLLADTIKSLSDHSVETTLVLVGVADSIEQLIGEHESVERNIVQIPMPRMKEEELVEIIDKALPVLEMTITPSARVRIPRLSEGLPHYTHLLALYAFRRAIEDDRNEVNDSDVDSAIKTAVDKAQHSIQSTYQKAIRSPRRNNLFSQVLLACALANKDDLGYFAAGAVRAPMSKIMQKRYEIPAFARHLDHFTKEEHGNVLTRYGPERARFYRFNNPLLQPYVILMGLSKSIIDESMIEGRPTVPLKLPTAPELPLGEVGPDAPQA